VQGSFSQLDGDIERYETGLEGELYFETFTLGGIVGYQEVNGGFAPFFGRENEAGFGHVLVRWYPREHMMVEPAIIIDDVDVRFGLGFESQISLDAAPGLAFFVDGIAGEDDFESIIGGLRYRFGMVKLLQQHHREDGFLPIRD